MFVGGGEYYVYVHHHFDWTSEQNLESVVCVCVSVGEWRRGTQGKVTIYEDRGLGTNSFI